MRRRVPVLALLAVLALALGLPAGAAAQSGVEELWKEYPLQQGSPMPEGGVGAGGDGEAAAAPSPRAGAGTSGDGVPVLALVGGGVAVVVLAAGLVVAGRRRGRRRAPAAGRPVHDAELPTDEHLAWAAGDTVMGEPGRFAGPVEYDGAEMVLVRDERRGPVWVWRSDVVHSDPAEQRRPEVA